MDIVPSVADGKATFDSDEYDVVMSDYDLDDGKGDEFVSYLRALGYKTPVIAISSHERGNKAIIQAGGDEVCSKMEFRKIGEVLAKFKS